MSLKEKAMIIRNYFNRGYEENARVIGVISHLMLFSVWLKLFFGEADITLLAILGVAAVIYFTVFGVYWDKWNLFDIDHDFYDRRHPILNRIETKQEHIEKKLEELLERNN